MPDGDAVDVVIDGLGLRAQPPPTRVRVGLISRRWKRFLLNERELGYALLDAGYDVRLLALEDMTLYEQVAALRATTLLVGVHGSGLNNALYLRPGAAVLQIVPFGLRYRGDFEGIATRNGVSYGELVLEDRRRSVFHWEFLDPERLVAGRAAVLDAGSPPGGREVYAFWVNQDVVVPRAAFLGAVRGRRGEPAEPATTRGVSQGLTHSFNQRFGAGGGAGGSASFSFSAAKGESAPRRTPARTAGVQSRADQSLPFTMTTSQRAYFVDSCWGSQATSVSAGCRGTSSGVRSFVAGRRYARRPPCFKHRAAISSRSQSTSAVA